MGILRRLFGEKSDPETLEPKGYAAGVIKGDSEEVAEDTPMLLSDEEFEAEVGDRL